MKEHTSKFSLNARKRSFHYALEGVVAFFRTEHNARIHLAATVIVIVLGFKLKVNAGEAALLALSVGFVWTAEIFNTAIEAMMDHLSPGKHEAVKHVKDISAAAVLFSAFIAVLVGAFIFLPKFF